MPRNLVDAHTLETLLAPLVAQAGLELVDARHQLEQGGAVLRVLIEHPAVGEGGARAGVSLDDCTRVTRLVSAALDAQEELFEGAYRLEVSSPGLERPLVHARDYERFTGFEAHISVHGDVEARGPAREPNKAKRKNFSGTILGLDGGDVVLRETSGQETKIAVSDIAKAHLVHRF